MTTPWFRRSMRLALLSTALALAQSAVAVPFFFSTGNVDARLGAASRPDTPGRIEIESADDFVIAAQSASITQATFIGLLPTGAAVNFVGVEIYRVFPLDSDVNRTSGPPTFSTSQVPTRVNSPSDVAFATRGTVDGTLGFSTSTLNPSFTVNNTIINGINPKPNNLTGGEGPGAGQEVRFDITFSTPLELLTGHYFFVPQVELAGSGDFLWLSSTRPIVSPGTPFTPDLQSWIRNANIDPDWMRMGTDIIGGTTFNMAFTLTGEATGVALSEPPAPALLVFAAMLVAGTGRIRRRSRIQ